MVAVGHKHLPMTRFLLILLGWPLLFVLKWQGGGGVLLQASPYFHI